MLGGLNEALGDHVRHFPAIDKQLMMMIFRMSIRRVISTLPYDEGIVHGGFLAPIKFHKTLALTGHN
jgi:hypothetical protein